MAQDDRSFLGVGWSFPPTFRREWYGVEMLVEEEDVRSSLRIIIETITGERVMLPTFGANLQTHVFESMTPVNLALIERIVRDALVLHEPRIIVEEIATTARQEEGVLDINVTYTLISTNTRYNHVYPFYLAEATNIEK
jgi:phage baseplate assembly protein W